MEHDEGPQREASDGPRTRFTVAALAQRLGAEVDGPGSIVVEGLNALDMAGPTDLSYIGSEAYAARWVESKAPAAAVTAGVHVPGHDPGRRALLRVPNADLALAQLLTIFAPPAEAPPAGAHPTAIIHPSARLDPTASIGARAIVGAGSVIGPRTILEPAVQIGRDAVIGADCILQAGVVIRDRCILHDRICIHANAVIGSDGFGYRPDGSGGMRKLPHIGIVEIHSDVEIGACTTIDRGKFGRSLTTFASGAAASSRPRSAWPAPSRSATTASWEPSAASPITCASGAAPASPRWPAFHSTCPRGRRSSAPRPSTAAFSGRFRPRCVNSRESSSPCPGLSGKAIEPTAPTPDRHDGTARFQIDPKRTAAG